MQCILLFRDFICNIIYFVRKKHNRCSVLGTISYFFVVKLTPSARSLHEGWRCISSSPKRDEVCWYCICLEEMVLFVLSVSLIIFSTGSSKKHTIQHDPRSIQGSQKCTLNVVFWFFFVFYRRNLPHYIQLLT